MYKGKKEGREKGKPANLKKSGEKLAAKGQTFINDTILVRRRKGTGNLRIVILKPSLDILSGWKMKQGTYGGDENL